jgi:hypothetical protein
LSASLARPDLLPSGTPRELSGARQSLETTSESERSQEGSDVWRDRGRPSQLNNIGARNGCVAQVNASENGTHVADSELKKDTLRGTGALIINADDWGRNRETTDRIGDCVRRKIVSSVSAMVFMEDSARGAAVAREQGVDAGLHLNFTEQFSAPGVSERLKKHQQPVIAYLKRRRINQAIFHPGLTNSFRYVMEAQLDEYACLFGAPPTRLDGHHHMHLCANVLFGRLMPAGTIARRNFSFRAGEKGFVNRKYRQFVDRTLARRHRLTDFFFALAPLEPSSRLTEIFSLSRHFVVEVETHPVAQDEYRFLTGGEFLQVVNAFPLADGYRAGPNGTSGF